MAKEKRTFVFNIDWRDVLMDYPAEVRHEVYDAIVEYAATGKLIDLKPLAGMAFSFIKKEMDYNTAKYEQIVKTNKENAKKGGAPPGNTNARKNNPKQPKTTQNNRTVEKTTLYDNDNDYVSTDVDDVVDDDNARERPGDKLSSEIAEMLAADLWQYEVQKSCHRTAADIRALLPAFETDCRANGIAGHDSIKDAKSHFCNWIRKKDQIKRKEQNNENRPTTSADRRRQGIDTLRRGIVEELAANNGYPAIISPGGTGTGD